MSSERVEACLRAVRGLLALPPGESLRRALNDCVLVLDDADDRAVIIEYIEQHTQGWRLPWLLPPWRWPDAPPNPFSSMMWDIYESRHGNRLIWCESWLLLSPEHQRQLLAQEPPPDPWLRWLDEIQERALEALEHKQQRLLRVASKGANEPEGTDPTAAWEGQLQEIVERADSVGAAGDPEPVEASGSAVSHALHDMFVWFALLLIVIATLVGVAGLLYWLGTFFGK